MGNCAPKIKLVRAASGGRRQQVLVVPLTATLTVVQVKSMWEARHEVEGPQPVLRLRLTFKGRVLGEPLRPVVAYGIRSGAVLCVFVDPHNDNDDEEEDDEDDTAGPGPRHGGGGGVRAPAPRERRHPQGGPGHPLRADPGRQLPGHQGSPGRRLQDRGHMIKGKTPEEIRKTLNIKNDFTPSEEEQVRKELLQGSDGEIFPVNVEIAKQSVTIRTMLGDLSMEEEESVPLPNVNAAILKKVIQWATYHKDDTSPSEDDENMEKRTDDISSWDADFLKGDHGTLYELILAANYLDIKGLLDICCKTVANVIKSKGKAIMIMGKTPEEIRKTFDIKNDFTPSDEEQVRKESEWCEEK